VLANAGGFTSRLRYQWQLNGLDLPNATNQTLTVDGVRLSDAGIYTVNVANPVAVPTSFAAVLEVIPLAEDDSDGDGMADIWEIAHGLKPLEASDAGQDPDHDGMTNLQEYLAGTDPQDGRSYLKWYQISVESGTCTVRFFAVSNKTYSILYKDAATAENWLSLRNTPAFPTNRIETITDTSASEVQRFYRLVTPAIPQGQ
jgi:hypothetical protein